MVRWRVALFCIVVIAMFTALSGCGGGDGEGEFPDIPVGVNLIENPSFEQWEEYVPAGWELKQIAGKGKKPNMFGKSTSQMKSGKFSFYLRGLFDTEKWMVLTQRILVRPGYDLYFSAEIKCENIKRNRGQKDNANIYVRFLDARGERLRDRYYADAYTRRRLGTGDWQRNIEKVEIPSEARYAEIGLINEMTGYLYFDDVEVMLLERTKWNREETEYVTFYYLEGHPLPEGAIEEQTRFMNFIVDLCGIRVEEKIKYYYYPSEARFMQILGTRKYKQRPFWNKKELHTIVPVEQHAMVHMVLVDLGYPPIGLAKGFVFALRGKYTGWNPHLLAKRFLVNKMIPSLYRIVDEETMKKSNWAITVPAWASFCTYLVDTYGMEAFIKFYRECNGVKEAGPFNDLFVKDFEKEFKIVDRGWRLYVLRVMTEESLDSLDFNLPPIPTFGEEEIDTMDVPEPDTNARLK
ncbi:MAG TPA: hypothetical protein VMX58_12935 [Patescibacteria group bacterium]|nr:hypothetical protein [Patescibacteria group bacterium]